MLHRFLVLFVILWVMLFPVAYSAMSNSDRIIWGSSIIAALAVMALNRIRDARLDRENTARMREKRQARPRVRVVVREWDGDYTAVVRQEVGPAVATPGRVMFSGTVRRESPRDVANELARLDDRRGTVGYVVVDSDDLGHWDGEVREPRRGEEVYKW